MFFCIFFSCVNASHSTPIIPIQKLSALVRAEFANQTVISHIVNSTSYAPVAIEKLSGVCRHKGNSPWEFAVSGLDLERRSALKTPVSEYNTHNYQFSCTLNRLHKNEAYIINLLFIGFHIQVNL